MTRSIANSTKAPTYHVRVEETFLISAIIKKKQLYGKYCYSAITLTVTTVPIRVYKVLVARVVLVLIKPDETHFNGAGG